MSGLGRGLQSLIPKKQIFTTDPAKEIYQSKPAFPAEALRADSGFKGSDVAGMPLEVSIELIKPNPRQPREHFAHAALEDLISSIQEHGIIQPLVVTKSAGGYELIAGERRLRAAKLAGLLTVPVIIRTASEQEKLELALIENLQRQDLTPIEEAKSYQKLVDEYSLTQEEVAKRVGKSRAVVANSMRLLSLPEEVQAAVADGRITTSNARTLAGLSSTEEQKKWFAKMMKNGMTAREAERSVTIKRRTQISDPQRSADEEELREALGTKVKIEKKAGKGMIAIGFYSEEEYRALVKRLKK